MFKGEKSKDKSLQDKKLENIISKAKENNETETDAIKNIENLFVSNALFKRLSKKYNKKLGKETNEEELISLIKSDLVLKKQNSVLLKEYLKLQFWHDALFLVMAAIGVSIVFDYFVSSTGRAGIFPAGIGALARFCANITGTTTQQVSSWFFIYQLILNIPLLVFGVYKIGLKFTILTLIYMTIQIAFDQAIKYIPVINPTDFHFITNADFIRTLPYAWNYSIWLIVLGAAGGLLMGWSYSLIYKIGGSTGGTDFITIYISNKKNKPVGSLNKNTNFIILTVVLIANTIIIPISALPKDIVLRELEKMSYSDAITQYKDFASKMLNFDVDKMFTFFDSKSGEYYIFDTHYTSLLKELKSNFDFSKDIPGIREQIGQLRDISLIKDSKIWNDILLNAVESTNFNVDVPSHYVVLIKLQYVIGPSLFGSLTLIIIVGITTNYFYPKYKLRTYLISTSRPDEVNKTIIDSGYENEIASWDTTNRTRGNYLHRTVFMITLPVMQWKQLQKKLFVADPFMKVTILRTKKFVGLFNYSPIKNDKRENLINKVSSDQTEIEKLHQIAVVKFKKEMEKANFAKDKLEKELKRSRKNKTNVEKQLQEIDERKQTLVGNFKSDLKEINQMQVDNISPEEHNSKEKDVQ